MATLYYELGDYIQAASNADKALGMDSSLSTLWSIKGSIAVENNNHYNTEAYDYITDAQFINKIVNDNNGRIYLAKDSRINNQNFKNGYKALQRFKNKIKHQKNISSMQSQRLFK